MTEKQHGPQPSPTIKQQAKASTFQLLKTEKVESEQSKSVLCSFDLCAMQKAEVKTLVWLLHTLHSRIVNLWLWTFIDNMDAE